MSRPTVPVTAGCPLERLPAAQSLMARNRLK